MAGNHDNGPHEVGSMDISEQQKTFVGFLAFAKWTVIATVVILIFMALANA